MFEISFLHEIKDVLSVEGYPVVDEDFVVKLFVQGQNLLDFDPLGPRLEEIDVLIDCIMRTVTFFYF